MSHLSISIPRHQTKAPVSSVQDNLIILTGSRKRGDISRVSHAQVVHSTAPSLIIDGACARLILNPERSVQPAAACSRAKGREGKASRCACLYPARCGRATAFEMMGHDWVAATRVHLFVQPGVPPLLFVSEGRWGQSTCLKGGRLGGRRPGPTPVPIGHRFSVLSRPPACAGYCVYWNFCGRLPRAPEACWRGGTAPTWT